MNENTEYAHVGHMWGDAWFRKYGPTLYAAIDETLKLLRECGIKCSGKEKFGHLEFDHVYFDEDETTRAEQHQKADIIFEEMTNKYPDVANEIMVEVEYYFGKDK